MPTVLAGFAQALARLEAAGPVSREHAAAVIRDAWIGNIESEGLVLTGAYRDSIHVAETGEGTAVVSDVDYASILELGDSRQEAHPVAQRALEEHSESALDAAGHVIREVLA